MDIEAKDDDVADLKRRIKHNLHLSRVYAKEAATLTKRLAALDKDNK